MPLQRCYAPLYVWPKNPQMVLGAPPRVPSSDPWAPQPQHKSRHWACQPWGGRGCSPGFCGLVLDEGLFHPLIVLRLLCL